MLRIVPDLEHHDLSRIKADANAQPLFMHSLQMLGVIADRLLHVECGPASLDCMPFAGNRCAEHCHHAVSHEAADRAMVTLDCFAHELRRAIQQLVRFFGIQFFSQAGRAYDVGKQHGHRFTFARLTRPRRSVGFGKRGGPGICCT